jgi:hypothetical protein
MTVKDGWSGLEDGTGSVVWRAVRGPCAVLEEIDAPLALGSGEAGSCRIRKPSEPQLHNSRVLSITAWSLSCVQAQNVFTRISYLVEFPTTPN